MLASSADDDGMSVASHGTRALGAGAEGLGAVMGAKLTAKQASVQHGTSLLSVT